MGRLVLPLTGLSGAVGPSLSGSSDWRSRLSSATSTTTWLSRVAVTSRRLSTIRSTSGRLSWGRSVQLARRRTGVSVSGSRVASHGMNAARSSLSWCCRWAGSAAKMVSLSVCTTRRSPPVWCNR